MEDDSTNSEMSDDDVTGGACACPGFPTSQTTESGPSTSAAPDQELQTANSDSQSSLESLPSATTSQSVASSEPIPGHTIEEKVQVRKDCLIYSSILVAALWGGNVTSSILPEDSARIR